MRAGEVASLELSDQRRRFCRFPVRLPLYFVGQRGPIGSNGQTRRPMLFAHGVKLCVLHRFAGKPSIIRDPFFV